MNKFTKADLKPNMIVELRSRNMYMIHEFDNKLVLIKKDGWEKLASYREDLLFCNEELKSFDIVTVRKPEKTHQLRENGWHKAPIIWERKELPKITEVERIVLENAMVRGERAKWIARGEQGGLYVYHDKPTKRTDIWMANNIDFTTFITFNHLFQFVKWEDDEPWYIPDLLEESE